MYHINRFIQDFLIGGKVDIQYAAACGQGNLMLAILFMESRVLHG